MRWILIAMILLGACQGTKNGNECLCDSGIQVAIDSSSKSDGGNSMVSTFKNILMSRRSAYAYSDKRSFSETALTHDDVAALLWAGQGVTDPQKPTGRPDVKGLRTAPSAGALYPIELYVAADNVDGMDPGLYWYKPEQDEIAATEKKGKLASAMTEAAMGQQVVSQAAAVIVVTAVASRTAAKYGTRAEAYVYMEVGHVAQNILLMAVASGLDARPVGAFDYDKMSTALNLPKEHVPVYIIPVGNKP